MVMILREDETVAYFSPYSEELTGYAAGEVLGRQFLPLFIPEWARADVSAAVVATLAGRSTKAYETPILCRDGRPRWIVWNARRLDEFEGRPAVLAVGQDFTERREAQERMLRTERLAGIGQMITGIAHESRNALQRIQSCTEMLELEIENNDEAQRLVRRLQQAQDNLLRLFEEVRGYAAPIQLENTPCRVDSIWREAWQSLETLRRGRDASLIEQVSDADLNVSCDRFRLVQVFRNLLENSLAACHDPVVIQIKCHNAQLHGQDAIEVRVRDNGPGLTPRARQSVFEPFFTTKTKGTGLGMAIARRIVDAHGGQISVGGQASSGAEFVITLQRTTT
jgi:PAS domain S-box-containing protein